MQTYVGVFNLEAVCTGVFHRRVIMNLCTHNSTLVPEATCQVLLKSVHRFLRRFLNVFTICGHGDHLGNLT